MNEVDKLKGQILSGLVWRFCERILSQGVSFIISIILARILLPSNYGIIAMVIVFITIANVFITSGFSTSLIQKKDADELDFSTIFYCNLVLSICIYTVFFITAPYIADFYNTPELTPVIRVFALHIPITAYNSIQQAHVSRNMMFKSFFFATLVGTIVSGIIGIAMALKGFGVWALIAQYLGNTIMNIVVLQAIVKWRPRLMFSWQRATGLVSYGSKVLAADLLGAIFGQLRSFIIGKVYTPDDLAFYNKGRQIPDLLANNVNTVSCSVLFPAMSKAGGERSALKSMMRRSMKISSYIIFPMMVGLAAIAKPLVITLLTEKWADCIVFLQLVSISNAFCTITTINLQAIKASGRSDVLLKLEFVKKPICLAMILISFQFGIIAVGISVPLYEFVAMLINMRSNKNIIGYTFKEQIQDLLPTALLTLIVGILTYGITLLPVGNIVILVLAVIIGTIVYLVLSWIFKIDSFTYLKDYITKFYIKAIASYQKRLPQSLTKT